MQDLEFGGKFWSEKYKNITKLYTKFKRHKLRFITLLTVVSLSLIIKWGLTNVDRVVGSATAISFEETPYKPIELGQIDVKTKITDVEQYEIKDSIINRKIQKMNIDIITNEIIEFLKNTRNICIHIKHFGVKYDILVFHNLTMINPQIISESKTRKNIPEISIDGEQTWSSRSTDMYIKYYNANLELTYTNLFFDQAYCFAYYMV